ncbi:MAG: FHA domain-containing protein [Planctomycetota bacterium]|jgi:class 3 adenylate cyclase
MAFIIVMTGAQEGDYYALSQGTNLIGRSQTLPIHILDTRISRRHLKICVDEGKQEYFAADMGSKGGVFINGKRINDDMALLDGDCITIGQTDLLFTLEDITDRETALHRVKIGKLEFPTINPSVSTLEELDACATDREGNRLQSFRQWAGSAKLTLAIVFTDMVDSTALTHDLGNERMDQVRRAHFARARSLIEEHKGYEIKTNGDEFMVAFRTAVNALDFALGLHADTGDERVSIRAGVHIGPVTVEEQDAQGAAVNYAARVVGMAAGGGVWLSSDVKNHIDQEKGQHHKNLCWQHNVDCILKGFPGKHLLWSVQKRDEPFTTM